MTAKTQNTRLPPSVCRLGLLFGVRRGKEKKKEKEKEKEKE
jgi:hypothetical protein